VVAGLVALAAHRAGLPVPLPLLAGTLAGAALGAWIELRDKAKRDADERERG
jgi:hypothetical protein